MPLCEECHDEEHDDYEMTGVMQESDDEGIDCLDRFDKDDGEEDNDYVWHGSREVPPPADEAGGAEIRKATSPREAGKQKIENCLHTLPRRPAQEANVDDFLRVFRLFLWKKIDYFCW